MTGIWILLGGAVAVAAIVWWHGSKRARRRKRLRAMRLATEDRQRLEALFPLWKQVPEATRQQAEGWIHVFLAEKVMEPCGGLEAITRDMQLAVAGPACLLIAHRPQDYYETLKTVLVYPTAFTVRDEWGTEDVRLGESWTTGSVVLAWETVLQGDRNPEDGLNVVLHEFAHQLDQGDGLGDGVPELDEPEDFGRWSAALAPAYEAFCERIAAGRRTVMDDYGAESPAEFFAVATETFFERAKKFRQEEPELHAELVRFYGMDPATW